MGDYYISTYSDRIIKKLYLIKKKKSVEILGTLSLRIDGTVYENSRGIVG